MINKIVSCFRIKSFRYNIYEEWSSQYKDFRWRKCLYSMSKGTLVDILHAPNCYVFYEGFNISWCLVWTAQARAIEVLFVVISCLLIKRKWILLGRHHSIDINAIRKVGVPVTTKPSTPWAVNVCEAWVNRVGRKRELACETS